MAETTKKEIKTKVESGIVESKIEETKHSPILKTVGDNLRKAREEKNITLEEVSEKLKIKVAQLKAIENNEIDKLPGKIYGIGFVKVYANYLELDSKEIVSRFKKENSEVTAPTAFVFPEPLDEGHVPNKMTIGVVSFLVIVFLIGWTAYSNMDFNFSLNKTNLVKKGVLTVEEFSKKFGISMPAPPPSDELELAEVQGETLTQNDGNVAASIDNDANIIELFNKNNMSLTSKISSKIKKKQVIVKNKNKILVKLSEKNIKTVAAVKPKINIKGNSSAIVLLAKHASWVQVTDRDRKVIFRKVLRAGDKYFVPNIKDLSLVTANAGGLDILVNGKKISSLGGDGEIVRGIALNIKSLTNRE